MASAQEASAVGLGRSCQTVLSGSHFQRTGTGTDSGAPTGPAGPGPAAKTALAVVAAYKRFLSPLLPRACRFSPSCSEYARLAILKYGFAGGILRALGRLLRCHPFHPGGVDLP